VTVEFMLRNIIGIRNS